MAYPEVHHHVERRGRVIHDKREKSVLFLEDLGFKRSSNLRALVLRFEKKKEGGGGGGGEG